MHIFTLLPTDNTVYISFILGYSVLGSYSPTQFPHWIFVRNFSGFKVFQECISYVVVRLTILYKKHIPWYNV